jgi:dolichol kinase
MKGCVNDVTLLMKAKFEFKIPYVMLCHIMSQYSNSKESIQSKHFNMSWTSWSSRVAEPTFVNSAIAISAVVSLQFLTSIPLFSQETDKLQLRRKLQHASSGLLIAYLGQFVLPQPIAVTCLAFSLSLYSLLLYLRCIPSVNAFFLQSFGPLLREHERQGAWPGAFWLLLAALFMYSHFDRLIASLAIAYISIGDPIAALTGQLFGNSTRFLPRGKSLVGFVCFWLSCFAFAVSIEPYVEPHSKPSGFYGFSRWQYMAAAGALAAAVAESLPLQLDDNLIVPITSAFVMLALQ